MKVLYADDHWITRSATQYLLERLVSGSQLIEAANFQQALDLAANTPDLDLVLLDLVMPGMQRIEGLHAMRRCRPQVPIVVLSAIEDRDVILRCIRAGAMGYIPKTARADEVESSLQTVLAGGVAFPRQILEQSQPSKHETVNGCARTYNISEVVAALTGRQLEIYKCLGAGMTNAQMSESLGLSEHTVRVHISAIVKRLQLQNRTQVAISAAALLDDFEDASVAYL